MPIYYRRFRPVKAHTGADHSADNNSEAPVKASTATGREAEEAQKNTRPYSCFEVFTTHLSQYVGQTVTIFVAGGGISGSGFTGVLLDSTSGYIRLLLFPGPPPCYSLAAAGFGIKGIFGVGSEAVIPVCKIAAFTHASLHSRLP